MEKKSWDFAGQAQINIGDGQLSWQMANGQSGSYAIQNVTSVCYENGGFLRLTSTLSYQLIAVPQTAASELCASEIQEYLHNFQGPTATASEPALTQTTSGNLAVDELAKLEHLKTIGFLTEEEFHQMKGRLQL